MYRINDSTWNITWSNYFALMQVEKYNFWNKELWMYPSTGLGRNIFTSVMFTQFSVRVGIVIATQDRKLKIEEHESHKKELRWSGRVSISCSVSSATIKRQEHLVIYKSCLTPVNVNIHITLTSTNTSASSRTDHRFAKIDIFNSVLYLILVFIHNVFKATRMQLLTLEIPYSYTHEFTKYKIP